MVDPTTFRDVMAQWPSGVTIVTTLSGDGAWHGMTASSFSSVSLEPPLVSICLSKNLYSHQLIAESGIFGVNVLAKDQTDVGRRFAGMDPGVEDRFAGETWTTAATGVPLLDSGLGWFDCRVVHAYPGGDHTIFVGEVLAGHAARRSAPLLFHSRGWGQFADVLPDVATLADGGVVAGLAAAGLANEAAHLATSVAHAGARVRVADLSAAASLEQASALVPRTMPLEVASVVVADRAQADLVLGLGVGTAELVLDPTDPVDVERVLAAVDGIAERCAVHLTDPFAADRVDAVLSAVQRLGRAKVLEIGLPDTAGSATPLQVRALLQEAVALARPTPLRLGLHDRDRLGLVKAITALKSGVRHFDSTLGGLGGAVATEDLIRLLEEVDVDTPVDTSALLGLARDLRSRHDETTPTTFTQTPTAPALAGEPEIVGATG
ncbi:flavin reductase [Aeromicrobium wangtongii]|uniref:Flavin reductase n=1 Tax=Aeromicrobium wangtongii TaxID=2969247 RepID=A0ABY5M6G1_9ACTN|nr:flavin reductase [Aeromicrobium wangtongii]MCD9198628.1 flavin reductase [Aeromicrobium wangtongii]UUP12654.1 flavin reductase [Aeromicrobium wangtongii]